MSANEIANLINFLDDEEVYQIKQFCPPETESRSTTVSSSAETALISPLLQGRESLDNNPFDSVQKLVNRPPDDPFESVEKEACFKARQHSALPPVEVKLGNLLSLSDDNLLDDNDDNHTPNTESTRTEQDIPKFGSDSTLGSVGSTIYHSATTNLDLDSESPPISMSIKWTPDSEGQSAPESFGASASSTDGGGSGAKTRSALEHRKRLLKLSISNSTFNSPVSRRMPDKPNNNEPGIFADDGCSPLSALFSKASLHGDEHNMLAAESPLKLVDDDLMSEEPPPQFRDSEKDFNADLEMLKIPMLKELPSPIVTTSPQYSFTAQKTAMSTLSLGDNKTRTATVIGLTDLAAIRAKLRAKREEANNNQDISLLIQNLRSLICDFDAGGDNQKRQQANSLLESLSSALAPPDFKETPPPNIRIKTEEGEESTSNLAVPPPIIRQGTFDMELQEKDTQVNLNCVTTMTQSTQSTHSVQSVPPFDDISDAMVRSSATYDAESAEDKEDIVLPEVHIDTVPTSPPPPGAAADVNDIIEQLSRLLEQHQFTQVDGTTNATGTGAATNATTLNPTFIVVMNTSTAATMAHGHGSTELSAKQRSAYVAKYMESSFNSGSPDLHNSSATVRRRSQSLSLHDKVKIVQLQMQPPQTTALKHATAPTVSLEQHNFPPTLTPPMDKNEPEFKTPSRMMLRRNSFSSGTPYTPITFSAAARRANAGTETMSRRSNVLETHHERQQHAAIVRPMPSFKPDLKKKLKSSGLHDSIMKSSGPLKATIPVKKVAPMLKISPTTPNNFATGSGVSYSYARTGGHNSSMRSTTKSENMAYSSTPMPKSRSAGTLGVVPSGYPNACSTPTVHRSPIRRISASMTKPRYSYMSATPTAKPVTSYATTAGLKRRTLSELSSKSPIKPRVSVVGSAMATTSKSASRTSLKLPQNEARFLNKPAQTSTATGRTSTRPQSTRASVSGSVGVNRNKENKKP